jgi:hypothetical protein
MQLVLLKKLSFKAHLGSVLLWTIISITTIISQKSISSALYFFPGFLLVIVNLLVITQLVKSLLLLHSSGSLKFIFMLAAKLLCIWGFIKLTTLFVTDHKLELLMSLLALITLPLNGIILEKVFTDYARRARRI